MEGSSLSLEVLSFFSSLGDSLQLPAPLPDLEKARGLPNPTRRVSVFSYLGLPVTGHTVLCSELSGLLYRPRETLLWSYAVSDLSIYLAF